MLSVKNENQILKNSLLRNQTKLRINCSKFLYSRVSYKIDFLFSVTCHPKEVHSISRSISEEHVVEIKNSLVLCLSQC